MPQKPQGRTEAAPQKDSATTAPGVSATDGNADPDHTDPTDSSPDHTDTGPDHDAPIEAWKLIVAVVGIFAVLSVAGLLAVAAFGGDDTGGSGATDTAIVDDFDRPDSTSSLGITPSGNAWESVSGTWGIADGQAYLVEANPEGQRSVATIDIGTPNGGVEVQAATMTSGWGIVFRYVGQFNYWYISAAPEYATYNITKIIDGTTVQVSKISLAPTGDGSTLRVQFRGPTIDVFIDDKPMMTLSDSSLTQATRVGLLAIGNQPLSARWANFIAETEPIAAAAGPGTPQGGVTPPPPTPPISGPGGATTIPVPAPAPAAADNSVSPADNGEGG